MRRIVAPFFLTAFVAGSIAAAPPSGQTLPVPATLISKSTRVPAGTYTVKSADLQHPAFIIRGSNLTVDFAGATLRGAAPQVDPDIFTGLAALVDGGENVTIENLTARGYKVGVLARRSTKLHLTGANLSYNWKARLYSLVEHESLLDWMSYHHNDKDKWLDQGAGIIVDEWGPYGWKSPKLWPDGRSDATPLKLRVPGPMGAWKVASVRGATVEPAEGKVPGAITVAPKPGAPIDIDVRSTYRGAAIVGPRGETAAAAPPTPSATRHTSCPPTGGSAISPSTRRRSPTGTATASPASSRARR